MNKACIEPVESISIISRAVSPIEFLFYDSLFTKRYRVCKVKISIPSETNWGTRILAFQTPWLLSD